MAIAEAADAVPLAWAPAVMSIGAALVTALFALAVYLAAAAHLRIPLARLLGAVPVYCYVAGQSPHGGGPAALLARLVPGWIGKLLVLILLGFTATDFVFTRILGIPSIVVPLAPYDENNHAPNESTKVSLYLAGIRSGLHLLEGLARG